MLGEVADVAAGDSAPQGAGFFVPNGKPFVRMQDIGRHGRTDNLTDTKDKVSDAVSARLKLFRKGSILVPKSGASIRLNHRAILGMDAHVVSHLAVITPRPTINGRFLYYWLGSVDMTKVAPESNYPSLRLPDLARVAVPMPPLPEQERLVRILDEADELRRLRAQADGRLSAFIAALFYQMFGDGQSFSSKPLIEFVDQNRGISYGVVQRGDNFTAGVPLLRILDFGGNVFAPRDHVFVDPRISEQYSRTVLQGGELVVSIRGTVGRVAIAPTEARGWNVAREVAVVPALPDVSRVFLHAYMLSARAQAFMTNEVRGIAQRGINLEDLRRLPIPIPSADLVAEFEYRAAESRSLQAAQRATRQRLDDLFRALQYHAFQGEL
jgi:type I restriction enzyme S subunit